MTHPVATTVIKNPSWWRRRTQLERVLTLVTVFTAGLCAVLVAALALTSYRQVHPSELLFLQIAADDNHVYVLEGHKVQKYNKRLEGVEEWELEGEGVGLAAGGETVGVVWRDRACECWLEVRGAVRLCASVASGLLAVCVGGKAVLYHPRPGKLTVRGSAGREEQLTAPPGQLAGLALSGRHVAALSVHPVRAGAGFSVHLLRRGSRGPWVEVHRAENRSPLAVLSGALSYSPGALVLTRRESSERAESTLQVALLDDGTELHVPGAAALLPRDSGSVVAVLADGAVHYSTHGRQRWALRLDRPLSGARLGPDFLLLWDARAMHTLTLEDGVVSQLELTGGPGLILRPLEP